MLVNLNLSNYIVCVANRGIIVYTELSIPIYNRIRVSVELKKLKVGEIFEQYGWCDGF